MFKNELSHDIEFYRKTLTYLGANVPIGVLCLPKKIERALVREGLVRVYDLIGLNLREIKGIGDRNAEIISFRVDEFLSVSF